MSPRGTLDGLPIEAPRGTVDDHWTRGVGILEGGLVRLQSCTVSTLKRSGGNCMLVTGGPSFKPAIVGCQLRGGKDAVLWSKGALGRLEGCTISGARNSALALYDPAPLVALPA